MKFFRPLFLLCIILYRNKNDDNCAKHHLDTCNTDEPKTNIEKKIKVLMNFVTWCSIPKGKILSTGGKTSCYSVYEILTNELRGAPGQWKA